jgi:large subunit ribosomal protein L24
MQITKPSKQRKMLYQAPLHARRKHFSARLSPKLKASRRVNALPVRSGDKVRVMRGDHRGFEGKVTRVDTKKYRVFIEGLTREKVDGTTIFVSVNPSKVMITGLNLDDKWRKKILERKKESGKELEKVKAEKPPIKAVPEKSIIPVEKPSQKKTKPKAKPKTKEKSRLKRKKAPKKPVKEKGKKEVKKQEEKETKAEKQKPLAKKRRSKPKSSRKAATSGRTEKSRTAGRGK